MFFLFSFLIFVVVGFFFSFFKFAGVSQRECKEIGDKRD